MFSAILLSSASGWLGCGKACPSEPNVELSADVEVGVGELKTVVHAEASSQAWVRGLGDACEQGKVRIKRYHWDLDGDGEPELVTTSAEPQEVHLTHLGKQQVGVRIDDAQGKSAEAQIELEVIDESTRSALSTIEVKLVAEPPAPACAEKICLFARTRLANLEVDTMQVSTASGAPPVIESRELALSSESKMIGCGALPAGADLSISPVTTSTLDGERYARDSDWSARTVCAARRP